MVNVTTGRTFSHNFTEFNATTLHVNGQVNMVGLDGNSSIVAVTAANQTTGVVYGWDIWTNTEWTLGRLPYFETNNDEWVPQLNSFINVEAQGSTQDRIEQVELQGTGVLTRLVSVGSLVYWTGTIPVNGEDWGAYNVTSHQFAIDSGDVGSIYGTFVFNTTYYVGGRRVCPHVARALLSRQLPGDAGDAGEDLESACHRHRLGVHSRWDRDLHPVQQHRLRRPLQRDVPQHERLPRSCRLDPPGERGRVLARSVLFSLRGGPLLQQRLPALRLRDRFPGLA